MNWLVALQLAILCIEGTDTFKNHLELNVANHDDIDL